MVRVSMAQRARQDRDDVRVGVFVGWGGGLLFSARLHSLQNSEEPPTHPLLPSSAATSTT